MIAYGYEQPVAITPTEIFNPTTANMVLLSMGQYANALREDYKDTRSDWKDFMTKYGDFFSTIDGATDAYYNAGIGGAMKKINDWEKEHGVSAIRSFEGRGIIKDAIAGANTKAMNTMRQSAKVKEEYDKAFAKLTPEQKEFEKWRLRKLGIDPQNWNHNELWNRYSPDVYEDLASYWAPKVKTIPKSDIMYDKNGKVTTDPSKAVTHAEGVSPERAEQFINVNMPQYQQSPSYEFLKEKISGQLQDDATSKGGYLSKYEADAAAEKAMKQSVAEMATYQESPKADDWALLRAKQAFEASIERQRASNKSKGSGTKEGNIFREADSLASTAANNFSGSFAQYVPSDSPHHKIYPAVDGVSFARTSDGRTAYGMNGKTMSKAVKDSYGNSVTSNVGSHKTVYFYPTGQLENYGGKYYISGTITGSNEIYKMEVREGNDNYGQKGNRQ